jgi:SH3-like domain-containing protein
MVIQEYCIFSTLIINSNIMSKLRTIIKNFPAIAFLLFFVTGCMPAVEKTDSLQMVIDSLSSLFVPDLRMGISDIKAHKGVNGSLVLAGETTSAHLRDELIKTLNKSGNKLTDSIVILPDTLADKKYCGLVTLSVINIRKFPDHRAEMVSQSVSGTPVRILKNKKSWFLIRTPDDYIGWVESLSVEPMTSAGMAAWKGSDRVIAIASSGWIYSSPDESGIIGDFVAGCIFVREGVGQSYTKVRLPDGREGFIASRSLTGFNYWKDHVRCTGETIVSTASGFTGVPYLWGGTSSKGFDCSGFSQTVYYLNGIILRRDASLQALHGTKVDISEGYGQLKPGDLLFFGTKKNSGYHVTHVAIYEGDGEYINAAGRIIANSLDSTRINYNGYRENSLLESKRIIGVNNDPGIIPVREHPWY